MHAFSRPQIVKCAQLQVLKLFLLCLERIIRIAFSKDVGPSKANGSIQPTNTGIFHDS